MTIRSVNFKRGPIFQRSINVQTEINNIQYTINHNIQLRKLGKYQSEVDRETINMEAVLHESTYVGNSKVGENLKYSGGFESVRPSVHANVNSEKVHFYNGNKKMESFQNTVDIEFENITFTATQGNILSKKSKYLYPIIVNNNYIIKCKN